MKSAEIKIKAIQKKLQIEIENTREAVGPRKRESPEGEEMDLKNRYETEKLNIPVQVATCLEQALFLACLGMKAC